MQDRAEVFKIALNLDAEDRAELADRLLASLDDLPEEEADRLWARESQRRLEEYRSGGARTLSAEELGKKAEKLFR